MTWCVGLLCFVFGLSGCNEKANSSPAVVVKSVDTNSYVSYQNNGLSLKHPGHWKFVKDNTDKNADRVIVFETPKLSRITIRVSKSKAQSTEDVIGHVIDDLKLEGNDYVHDYKRSPVTVDRYSGFQLVWNDSLMFDMESKLTVLKVSESPSLLFAKFHLLGDDVAAESAHMLPFIESFVFAG